jgi:LPS-assembly protein
VNKFSGYDRIEGGGRVNYGVQYTAQFAKAGSLTGLFGQSYQLYGDNSYALADPVNAGVDSGLDTRLSDYVGSLSYKPNQMLTFSSRVRLDQADVRREARRQSQSRSDEAGDGQNGQYGGGQAHRNAAA